MAFVGPTGQGVTFSVKDATTNANLRQDAQGFTYKWVQVVDLNKVNEQTKTPGLDLAFPYRQSDLDVIRAYDSPGNWTQFYAAGQAPPNGDRFVRNFVATMWLMCKPTAGLGTYVPVGSVTWTLSYDAVWGAYQPPPQPPDSPPVPLPPVPPNLPSYFQIMSATSRVTAPFAATNVFPSWTQLAGT